MITNLILLILVVSCLSEEQPTSNEVVIAQKGSSLYHWHERRAELREAKLTQLIAKIQLTNVPEPFDPIKGSALHNPTGQAVFTVAMDTTYMRRDARNFVKTLRLTGYKGDIVVAVMPGMQEGFMSTLKEYNCVVYMVEAECQGPETGHRICNLKGEKSKTQFSVNMIRYHLYRWWAMKYEETATVLVSDFRDVFFQSNPFEYHTKDWNFPKHDLVVFQEAHPLKTLGRCPFNSGWLRGCYGRKVLHMLSHNPVSCSGVSMGTRNGILAYAYMMTQHLNPKIRYGRPKSVNSEAPSNDGCISVGMDQGFHNYLVYSGALSKVMRVKIFQQGEGPVNTVGAFFPGARALIKRSLQDWQVLRGESGDFWFTNWNGDPSPVIHQYDRFLDKDLKPDTTTLRAMKNIYT